MSINKNQNKLLIFIKINIYLILAIILNLFVQLPYLINIVLFYLVPVFILVNNKREILVKSLLISTFIGIPCAVIIDYVLTYNRVWHVNTIFNHRIFGLVPYEDIIWGFMLILYTIVFYEFFLDDQKKHNFKIKFIPLLIIFSPVYFLIFANYTFPYILHILGIPLLILPTVLFLLYKPKLTKKFIITGTYFFIHSFIVEVINLRANQWSFNDDGFLFWIKVFGVKFPFEELLYWFIFLQIAILTYYEIFCDDQE